MTTTWYDILIGTLSGTLSGIIAYYASKGIDRYLVRRTVRSRQRQIEQLTQELQLLEKLGVTDRILMLFAFKTLFALIGIFVVGVAGSVALQSVSGPPNAAPLMLIMVALVVAIVAFYATSLLRKLEDPEPSLAELRRKLSQLQEMDNQSPTA